MRNKPHFTPQPPVQDPQSLRAYLRRNIAEVHQFAGDTPALRNLWNTAFPVPTPDPAPPGEKTDRR